MITKIRRRHGLQPVCAFGVLLFAIVPNLRSDRAVTSTDAPRSALMRTSPWLPRESPAMARIHKRLRYIVQSNTADAARRAVQDAGGLVTNDLSVIRAVGAALDNRELAALRDRKIPHLQV